MIILSCLTWYLLITLTGFLAYPLAYRLFSMLPDRGYALSRALGMLVWGYIFWILTSLGILYNDRGGILLALFLLAGLSGLSLHWSGLKEMLTWLRSHSSYLVSVEIVCLMAFVFLALVRAANPDIVGTEKPMELAFINAILRSPSFPPHDPWLSGYAISYYYFGYVLVAMLAKLAGISGSVAFNLGLAATFAMSAAGLYGVVYNLLQFRMMSKQDQIDRRDHRRALVLAVLGVIMVLIIGNLEGFLEIMHTRGVLWKSDEAGELTSSFWQWLDIKELNIPPAQPFRDFPERHWWWWRASRVVQDYNFAGQPLEIINEFPSFSFVLGDLHPHVLAMPFVILAIGLAINTFHGGGRKRDIHSSVLFSYFRIYLDSDVFLLTGIILGGLAFLNTWDFPFYLFLFVAAYILDRVRHHGWAWERLTEFVVLGFFLGAFGGLFYLPFYLGFSSQAGGFLPNLIYPTRGAHFWVMFAPLLLPILVFLIHSRPREKALPLKTSLLIILGLLLSLWLFSFALGFVIASLPGIGNLFLGALGAPDWAPLFREAIYRRFQNSGAWLTLAVLLVISLAFLIIMDKTGKIHKAKAVDKGRNADFIFLLIFVGGLLALLPEFLYLRDQFGWRINTIFKFYYQVWLMWGIAAAYGMAVLLLETQRYRGQLTVLLMGLVLVCGIVYPAFAFPAVTNGFRPVNGWTLDGIAFFERNSPDEMAAIRWLQTAPDGVVAEAIGGSYSEFARVATYSGLPTVLGWPGHESQWRGGVEEMGSRQVDIENLYRTNNWREAEAIINSYNIRYVYVGSLERWQYGVRVEKFDRYLSPVFHQGNVIIYETQVNP